MNKQSESRMAGSDQAVINIFGEKVALGPLSRDHVRHWHRWQNDFEVVRFHNYIRLPRTFEQEEKAYEEQGRSDKNAGFSISETSSMRLIGWAGLYEISHVHSNAEFGIFIGEKECWGKGYGTEVTSLILDFGFTCLNLRSIWLRVNSLNERGIRAYERAGFRTVGRLREHYWRDGTPSDEFLMDCLATEFKVEP